MFAALLLLSVLGMATFYTLNILEWLVLRRWHPRFAARDG